MFYIHPAYQLSRRYIAINKVIVRGFKKGLSLTWELVIKVVLPVYILVTLLTYTPVIKWFSEILTPLMQLVGLPGEAALPLVLASFASVYAGIGAVVPLGFDVKELTIIAAMILIAHDIPIEAAISKKTGSPIFPLVTIRFVIAFLVGFFVNHIM